jgi:hypothetical protein
MIKKKRPRPGATVGAKGRTKDGSLTRQPYSTAPRVPQITFARWCVAGKRGQTNLDPEIAAWIVRLMSEREAAGINTLTSLMRWIALHKPRFTWTTKLEWERVVLSARAMWIAYCRLMQTYQHEEEVQ